MALVDDKKEGYDTRFSIEDDHIPCGDPDSPIVNWGFSHNVPLCSFIILVIFQAESQLFPEHPLFE